MWEHCGFYDVPDDKKDVMEFTIDGEVCADYCTTDRKDEETCNIVYWYKFRNEVRLYIENIDRSNFLIIEIVRVTRDCY
jgi:hypothetical protein